MAGLQAHNRMDIGVWSTSQNLRLYNCEIISHLGSQNKPLVCTVAQLLLQWFIFFETAFLRRKVRSKCAIKFKYNIAVLNTVKTIAQKNKIG